MIVYETTKTEFLQDVFQDELVNNIYRNYNAKIGRINEGEDCPLNKYMYRVLSDHEIPKDVGIAIEFKSLHFKKS